MDSLGIIKNVLNISKLSTNLISVKKLIDDIDYKVSINNDICEIFDKVTRILNVMRNVVAFTNLEF